MENVKNNYKKYGDFYFTKDTTDEKFMQFINDAYNFKRRVKIVYKDGWQDFSGYHGGDGLHHSMYIGRTGGDIQIPIILNTKNSMGGYALLTCDEAIYKYEYVL